MWNNFAGIAQDSSYRRLALALGVSILLHAMLFGGVNLSLPYFKKEMHTIEARLQMPKVAVKQAELPKPELKEVPTKAESQPKPSHKPKPPPKPEPIPEAPETTNSAPTSEAPPVESPLPSVAQVPENIEPTPEEPEQAVDAGLVINENAYRYVETYFDVSTKIDGPAEGKAKIVFDLINSDHYQLNFLIEPKGFAALILPNLLQTSDGLLTKKGLQPLIYEYKFGDKTDKSRKAVFDWQANILQLSNKDGVTTQAMLEGSQDVLSFMYQFMYVAPLQTMQINITNGKKLREYDYQFEGEENVNSALGEVKTMHIAHTGTDTDEKIELWLAINYQYIPVKIRKIDKNGKIYEFVANRIVTNRP